VKTTVVAAPNGKRLLTFIGFENEELVMLRGAIVTFLMGAREVKWKRKQLERTRANAWRLFNSISDWNIPKAKAAARSSRPHSKSFARRKA